jgi:hypothetical protein
MMRGRGGAGNSDDGAPPALLSCDAPEDGQVDAPGEALEEAVEGVPQPDGRGELSHAAGRGGGGGGGLGECWGTHGLRAGDEGRRARGPHAAVDVADAAELVEDVREDEVCARGDGRGEEERERGGESGPANLGGTRTCCSGMGRGGVSSASPRTVRRCHHGRGRGTGRGEGGAGRVGGVDGCGGRRLESKQRPPIRRCPKHFLLHRPAAAAVVRTSPARTDGGSLSLRERGAHRRLPRRPRTPLRPRPPNGTPALPSFLSLARTRATPPRAPLGMMRNTL